MNYYKNPFKNIFNLKFIGINILCAIGLISLYFFLDKAIILTNMLNIYIKILNLITFIAFLLSFFSHWGITPDGIEGEDLNSILKRIYHIDTFLLQIFCIRLNLVFIISIISLFPKYVLTIY